MNPVQAISRNFAFATKMHVLNSTGNGEDVDFLVPNALGLGRALCIGVWRP
jgi:hypothetical protein